MPHALLIPEITEMVFLSESLTPIDLLTTCRAVCWTWKGVIERSPDIVNYTATGMLKGPIHRSESQVWLAPQKSKSTNEYDLNNPGDLMSSLVVAPAAIEFLALSWRRLLLTICRWLADKDISNLTPSLLERLIGVYEQLKPHAERISLLISVGDKTDVTELNYQTRVMYINQWPIESKVQEKRHIFSPSDAPSGNTHYPLQEILIKMFRVAYFTNKQIFARMQQKILTGLARQSTSFDTHLQPLDFLKAGFSMRCSISEDTKEEKEGYNVSEEEEEDSDETTWSYYEEDLSVLADLELRFQSEDPIGVVLISLN